MTNIIQKRLALFDLDNTLIPLDSDYQWADFLIKNGNSGMDSETANHRNDELMSLYNRGELTIEYATEFTLGLLSANEPHKLAQWHEDFMKKIIRPVITPQAICLVREHLEAGDLCAIVTSTNNFVTEPLARAFGIETLIATNAQYTNGRYTGKINGIPSFKEYKVKRVEQWLNNLNCQIQDFCESFFYSDSINDMPLLQAVTKPIAVNPSNALRNIALKQGWKILNLFNSISK